MIAAARRIAAPGAGAEGALAADQERQAALARTLHHDLSDRVASFERALDEVREPHLALSREMNREVEAILALDRTTSKAPALIMIA